MDPINNQNPVPTPQSAPQPAPGPAPVMPPVQPVSPTQPTQPVAPTPTMPPVPPVPPVQPQAPVPPAPTAQSVANPVIMPNGPHNAIGQDFVMPQPQGASVSVANPGLVNATDPITMPTPPKAPDPVEEELKAPLKAAEPVPGSIGSAISVPVAEEPQETGEGLDMSQNIGRTPSVSFTDPAATVNTAEVKPVKMKKKTSKNTLIALTIVAIMVVIALAAVLILMMNGIL